MLTHGKSLAVLLFTGLLFASIVAGPARAQEDPGRIEVTTTRVLAADNLSPLERAQTLVTRGIAREALSRPKDALDDFTYAISLYALPVDELARARFNRAVVLEELNRLPEALADYTLAINLQRRFAAALNNRANLYRRMGRLAEATADYSASLASGNAQGEYPLYGLGQISEALGKVEAARGYYEKALAANPHYALAAQRLAVLNGPEPLTPGSLTLGPLAPAGLDRGHARPPPTSDPTKAPGWRPAN